MVPILSAEQAVASSPPPPPARPAPVQNHVADQLPLLQAEVAQGPPAGTPAEPTDWRAAPPPPKRQPGAAPAAPAPTPAPAPADPTDWRSAPPPKRQPGAAPVTPPAPSPRVAAPPPAAPAPADPSDWRSAPPPPKRQPGAEKPAEPAAPPPRRSAGAREPAPTSHLTPPPVRRVVPGGGAAPLVGDVLGHATKAKRRNKLFMSGVVGALVAVLVLAGWIAVGMIWETEAKIRGVAEEFYTKGQYSKAFEKYKQLVTQFPESTQAEDYAARLELCDFRAQAESAVTKPEAMLELVEQVLKEEGKSEVQKSKQRELSKEYGPSLEKAIKKVADALSQGEGQNGKDLLKRTRDTLAIVPKRFPGAFSPEQQANLNDALQNAENRWADASKHREAIRKIKELAAKDSSGRTIKDFTNIVARRAEDEPDFPRNAEVTELQKKLQEAHLASITYNRTDKPPGGSRGEDLEPSLLVAQRLDEGLEPVRRDDDPVWLALARGVLYALSQRSGRIIWAMRVGIDTATLPVRVPPSGGRPEMVLVPSTDTETLTALNVATGEQRWKYRLGAPCVGQPLIVDQRAYLPTYDGKVHEIELARGESVGWYDLGSKTRLTVGGTRQEGAKLLYFPADEFCVYVLDVANHRCQTILYSQHLAGTLRSEPIIATPGGRFQNEPLDPPNAPEGYLILCLADGFREMTLRVFGLPIDNATKPPLQITPEPRLPGWPWFGPYQDAEKLVLATDAGSVGLYGVRQLKNSDNALFSLLPKEFRLDPGPGEARPGRAQVVHAQGDDLWVIAHGTLRHLQLNFDPVEGQKLFDRWKEPLLLGSPMHRSQPDRAGKTLFLVTQSLTRRVCLATAVDADTGEVRWQRQLGLVCRGQPVLLGDQVLALDQGGGVFAFSPASHPPPKTPSDTPWGVGGQYLAGPPALEDNPALPPALYPGADGMSAYEVAAVGKGDQLKLLLRRFELDRKANKIELKDDRLLEISSPPAGLPAIGPDSLLLPLEEGIVLRVPLAGGNPDMSGPDWRGGRAQAGVRCQLAWVNADQFLNSDGSRGLSHRKRAKGLWQTFPLGKDKETDEPTAELPARIVAPPALLPPQGGKIQVCVAEASGGLTLLESDDLTSMRRWELGGKITAGPFVEGNRVGCIVDRSLVWIDPMKDGPPLWKYTAQEEIVGRPQLIGGLLVVADRAGRFVGLDPATGQPAGKGYTLKASAAPAAGLVPFGKDRAFAALTDGTVLLLSLQHLRP
jgi:hypothetical protein